MERKYVLPFVLVLSGACHNQPKVKQPEPVIVDLTSPVHESSNNDSSSPEIHNPQTITPSDQVTEMIRGRFKTVCMSIEPQKSCSLEQLRLFRTMRKKLPKTVDHGCRPDGEYESQCIEDAYKLQFGEDKMYKRLSQVVRECKARTNECSKKQIQNCKDSYTDCIDRLERKIYGPNSNVPHKHKHP